jgi:hypothetical protein
MSFVKTLQTYFDHLLRSYPLENKLYYFFKKWEKPEVTLVKETTNSEGLRREAKE